MMMMLMMMPRKYVLRGELKRNKTGTERGELVTLLDEPYLAFLFNYLPSPPSAPAVGAMSFVVTAAYIAAVVEHIVPICSLRFRMILWTLRK
jgi:hypothetical protein